MKVRIRIQGLIISSAIILVVIFMNYLFPRWNNEWPDKIFDFLGINLILLGFTLRLIARQYKSEMSKVGHQLVTGGIYTFVRNPMYFGVILIGLGIVNVLFMWWIFLLFLIFFRLIYMPQIIQEEKFLKEKFGEQYVNYLNSTPSLIFNIFKIFWLKGIESYFINGFKREWSSVLGVVVGVVLVEIWQDSKLFTMQEALKGAYEYIVYILIFLVFVWGSFLLNKKSINFSK